MSCPTPSCQCQGCLWPLPSSTQWGLSLLKPISAPHQARRWRSGWAHGRWHRQECVLELSALAGRPQKQRQAPSSTEGSGVRREKGSTQRSHTPKPGEAAWGKPQSLPVSFSGSVGPRLWASPQPPMTWASTVTCPQLGILGQPLTEQKTSPAHLGIRNRQHPRVPQLILRVGDTESQPRLMPAPTLRRCPVLPSVSRPPPPPLMGT